AAFPGAAVRTVRRPTYNLLAANTVKGNYVFINRQFKMDRNDLRSLLDFAREGNTVFIAAESYDEAFADSLGFRVSTSVVEKDSLVHFLNPLLGGEEYPHKGSFPRTWFSLADSANTVKLAADASGKAHFIRTRWGKGNFYLHSRPGMFSNYHLLRNEGHEYTFRALSYLPVQAVWWDEYYKQGREGNNSIFGVIARYGAVRWAWYLLLGGVLLFIIFGGKRRQRVIPLVKPLRNTSLEFAGVVSTLYYNQQDFKDIAMKKIRYFLENVRNRYQESAEDAASDPDFTARLASRSGLDKARLEELFRTIRYIRAAEVLSEAELHLLNGQIEDFYGKQA
ncbi:MAG TPA: DUF4350 domain-containing protein, partial [Anseongella sp.]|nr:DUF4350 domain-containing protein [Anseongella sp.]